MEATTLGPAGAWSVPAITCPLVLWSCAAAPIAEVIVDCTTRADSGGLMSVLAERVASLDSAVDTVVFVWSEIVHPEQEAASMDYELNAVTCTASMFGLYGFSDRRLGLSGRSVRLHRSVHVVLAYPGGNEWVGERAASAMRAVDVAFEWELSGSTIYLVVPATYRVRAVTLIDADPALKPYRRDR